MVTAGLKSRTDLVSAEYAQLLLPKLTDGQLATLTSYGFTEETSVGQVLAAGGDLSYDLMVVLEGEVGCSDIHDGCHRAVLVHGPRGVQGRHHIAAPAWDGAAPLVAVAFRQPRGRSVYGRTQVQTKRHLSSGPR
jgi:hypothetical protein